MSKVLNTCIYTVAHQSNAGQIHFGTLRAGALARSAHNRIELRQLATVRKELDDDIKIWSRRRRGILPRLTQHQSGDFLEGVAF